MCGICGIILTGCEVVGLDSLPSLLERMTGTLAHRGPDDQGTRVFADAPPSPSSPAAALGHRRLSIIDLATGHQPMSNEDGSVWTVFNGEVYNFPDLRRDLIGAGHTMATRTDTECILHLYEDRGEELVEALRGMFAFAVWDKRRLLLTLARDRLGQKPLYYLHDPGRGLFAFASELKALCEIPGFDRSVSTEAIDHYLTYQYVPHPMCIFRSVRKLPPAHTLVYDPARGTVRLRRYWRPEFVPDLGAAPEKLREALRAELAEATRMRLISDVPLGAFLSGGLDSSITVALMAQASSRPVRTFSIGFEEARYDETRFARMVAEHCRTEHTEETVRPQALEVLPKLVWHYDEPFGDSSAIPTYYVSQMARRHVTVVLTGDAGDECFAGYPRYAAALLGGLYDRLPRPLRALAGMRLWNRMPVSLEAKTLRRRLRRFLGGMNLPPQERYLSWITIFGDALKAGLCTDGFRDSSRDGWPADFLDSYYREVPGGDFVHRTTYVDLMTYLPCDLLTKVDIASMAHGLEARSPFLDHKVVELAGRIPMRQKLRLTPRGVVGKLILKETFGPMLPAAILRRRKMGFGVPIAAWLRGELKGLVQDVLLSRASLERGYFVPQEVRRMVDEHTGGLQDHGYRLWYLLMLELWHRRFVDGCEAVL